MIRLVKVHPIQRRLHGLRFLPSIGPPECPSVKRLTVDLYIDNSRYMEIENAVLALAALAQSTRLEVFRLLVTRLPDGLPAGDIARSLAIPQNTMSSHLAVLARAKLVS